MPVPSKKAFLIVAHGSRRAASNQEIEGLASRLCETLSGVCVAHAFLELASPLVEEAVDRLAQEGVAEITVLPYFLGEGMHVASDLPLRLESKQKEYPALSVRQLPHLGKDPEFFNWLFVKIRTLCAS